MSLPTVRDLKSYARITHDEEDDLLRFLLRRAVGAAESFLGKPITATSMSFIDDGKTGRWDEAPRSLIFPMIPFDAATMVVLDREGATVDPTTYTVDSSTGILTARYGYLFPFGPYTMTANVGLSTASTYATRDEPLLSQCILDIAVMYYQQRTAGIKSESVGDLSVSYESAALPPRTRAALEQLRGFVLAP